jgi:hypothetical protein
MIRTPFRISGALAVMLVITAAFVPARARAQGYTAPRDAQVDAAGARVVQIEAAAGSLRVQGVAGLTQVRVRGTARASSRSLLPDIKLIAERRGNIVFIKADIPDNHNGRGLWDAMRGGNWYRGLDLVIDVPITLPLDVTDGSGEAEFINVGAVSLTDGSGELTIRGARGNVEVNDGSGSVDINGVEGSVRIHDGSGEIRARNVTGDFIVEDDGSGNIDVSGVGGTMRVENDGSGNIDVDRVAGDFVVREGGSGTISYDTVKGNVSVPERRRRGSR